MGKIADDLVEAFTPWMTEDLETYLRAIGDMFEPVEDFVLERYDSNGNQTHPGWGVLWDIDLVPAIALDYIAQYAGERLPAGLPEADKRTWIKKRPNARRGSRMSIVRAAQRTLTGQKTVFIHERDTGSTDDNVGVYTLPAETPDAARVQRDIRTVLPADIVLNWGSTTAQSWTAATTGHTPAYTTWTGVAAAYTTWAGLQTTSALPAGWVQYDVTNT